MKKKEILYIPKNENDASNFMLSFKKMNIKKAMYPGVKQLVGIIDYTPIGWISNKLSDSSLLKESLEEYSRINKDEICTTCWEDIEYSICRHELFHYLVETHEEDWYKSIFMTYPTQREEYFYHQVYDRFVPITQYENTVFSDKLYFLRKILVGLGAKYLDVEATSLDLNRVSEFLNFEENQYNDIRETKNDTYISCIYNQDDNKPDDIYKDIKDDYFDEEDGTFLFPQVESIEEAYKMYQWVYNDDRELRFILENRMRQLSSGSSSKTQFKLNCKFESYTFSENDLNTLSEIGLQIGTKDISRCKSTFNLEVKF